MASELIVYLCPLLNTLPQTGQCPLYPLNCRQPDQFQIIIDRKRISYLSPSFKSCARNSTTRSVSSVRSGGPTVCRLVTLSFFWRLRVIFGLLLLPNCLVGKFHYCPCPPTRELGSRVSGLVFVKLIEIMNQPKTDKNSSSRTKLYVNLSWLHEDGMVMNGMLLWKCIMHNS